MIKHQVNNPEERMILVCCGTGCLANGSGAVYEELCRALEGNDRYQVKTLLKQQVVTAYVKRDPWLRSCPMILLTAMSRQRMFRDS